MAELSALCIYEEYTQNCKSSMHLMME